jgi:hypothetical protein
MRADLTTKNAKNTKSNEGRKNDSELGVLGALARGKSSFPDRRGQNLLKPRKQYEEHEVPKLKT